MAETEVPLWLPDQALFTVLLMTLPMVFSTMGRVQVEVVVASKVVVGQTEVDMKANMETVMSRGQAVCTSWVLAGSKIRSDAEEQSRSGLPFPMISGRNASYTDTPYRNFTLQAGQDHMRVILILRRTLLPLITVYLTLAIIYHALKMDWPPFENKLTCNL
uniref:Uncharacterized protein n=1 Tax=Oryza glaberrima TaxID=4538 RepID=I1R023_ORYGL